MTTFLGAIGVPHYTKDGKLYTGEMHKDASGRLMSGKFHTANSQFLFHTKNGIGAIKTEKDEIISLNKKLIFLNKQFNQVQRSYYKTQSIIDDRRLDDLSSKMAQVSSRLEYLEK